MANIMLVFVGGGLGAVSRYLVTTMVAARLGSVFPWGTLTVNALGSLLMGIIMGMLIGRSATLAEPARLLLTVGFLGGFTTFSSFSMETLTLLRGGSTILALINIGGSITLGLLMVGLGLLLVRLITA